MFAMQMFDILSFIVPIMFIVVFSIIIFPSAWGPAHGIEQQFAQIDRTGSDRCKADRCNTLPAYQCWRQCGTHGFHTTSSTTYYVTFQIGKRGPDGVPCFRLRNMVCLQRVIPAD